MNKIKKWDKVQVLSGSFKWSVSVVEKIEEDKVYLKWVNVRKKAVKKQWFVERTLPIHISNIAIYSEKLQKPTKVWIKKSNWKNIRYCKKTQEEL